MSYKTLFQLCIICALSLLVSSKVVGPLDILQELVGAGDGRHPGGYQRPCPLCDSSVYGYCSEKLFHDSCCCSSTYDHLPHQCQLADCSFLHANTCYEHRLITQCCCTNYLVYRK